MCAIFLLLIPIVLINNFNQQLDLPQKRRLLSYLSIGIYNLKTAFCQSSFQNRRLFTAFLAFALGTESILVAMPLVAVAKFEATPKELSLLFAVGGLASLISSSWINHKLSNRYNSTKIVYACSMLLLLAYLLFLPSFSFVYLFLPWIIMTINCLLVWAHSNAIISSRYGAEEQGAIMGITQSLVSLAIFIGPLLVGLLAHIDVRISFLVSIIAGTVALWLFCISSAENGIKKCSGI